MDVDGSTIAISSVELESVLLLLVVLLGRVRALLVFDSASAVASSS